VLAAVSVSSLVLRWVLPFFRHAFRCFYFGTLETNGILLIALIVPLETYFEECEGSCDPQLIVPGPFPARSAGAGNPAFDSRRLWWVRDPVAAVGVYLVTAGLAVLLGFVTWFDANTLALAGPARGDVKIRSLWAALVPGALAASLSFAADRYLVGYYSTSAVGIYSVCFTVSALGFSSWAHSMTCSFGGCRAL